MPANSRWDLIQGLKRYKIKLGRPDQGRIKWAWHAGHVGPNIKLQTTKLRKLNGR